MNNQAEISQIEAYITSKSMTYDFDAEYQDAQRRLVRLRNPDLNYDISRRSAMYRYIQVRGKGCSSAYMSSVRQDALASLAAVKADFAALLIKGA